MSVLSGLQHQVKMIRHQTVRENVDRNSALRLDKRAQTGIVIFGTFEETELLDSPIDDVKDESCSLRFESARHLTQDYSQASCPI